jgi:DnaK suppressor protein
VSKTPAPKAPPKKPTTKAPIGKASTAVARSARPSTAAAKPSAKIAAKPAAKVFPKPAPKPLAKSPATAPAKAPVVINKSAPVKPAPTKSNPVKPVAKPAAAAPVAPATKPAAVVQPAPAPVMLAGGLAPVVMRKSGRSASKYPAPAVQAPLPAPTSRFADRFAPPRPPTRQMSHVELDTPRQAQKSDPKLANAWKAKAGRDLTEPEVLAMPDSEYMNDKQLEFFRLKLQTLKDDLLSNAGETTEHLREDTSIVPDPADRATIEEEHALELRTRDRERKLLKKISQSLLRIDSGEYGFCDETGEPIGLGRLIARPTATLSLEAQQRRELKQKMFGD